MARSSRAGLVRALLIIDNEPLKASAWNEFHAARKKLDKTSQDLHRHEQVDVPAYDTWIHRTFPVLITTLRQLHEEVFLKERQIMTVQSMAEISGESERALWRELKESEANPEARKGSKHFGDEEGEDDDPWSTDDADGGGDDPDEQEKPGGERKSRRGPDFDFDPFDQPKEKKPPIPAEAKEIYRRLVQLLHPDRGGEWTATRERLWHEVQEAWELRDADWLARLEIEWETANDVLTPNSPVGRLKRAILDLIAARRDIERKLRIYRNESPWRFTLNGKKRAVLHAVTEENFNHDIFVLKRKLTQLNDIIALWERPRKPSRKGKRGRRQDVWATDSWFE